MPNTLSDFPPDQFAITAHCTCGHSAQIDYRLLPPGTLVNSLRPRLVCKVCGRRDPGIRLDLTTTLGNTADQLRCHATF